MAVDQLSIVFGALADPTRRAILARLTTGDANVAELAAPFHISQPAISKHLKVLEEAGLISRHREATARLSHLEAAPLREATHGWPLPRVLGRELRSTRRAARVAPALTDPAGQPARHEKETKSMGTTKTSAPEPGCRSSTSAASSTRRATSCTGPGRSPSCSCSGSDRDRYEMIIDEYDVRDGGR